MRRHLILFAFVCVTFLPSGFVCPGATVDAAERTFPYKAQISADDVYVRSGPGRNYYPTDKLKTGQTVEVYRHDPGGWYAIRPPKGSFTWVSSRFVRRGRDGLAEVTGARVAARVGSRFSDIRDVIQVRLKEGELIDPLPSADLRSAAARASSTKWTKIAPPSGEYRWVHGKFVDSNYAQSGIRKAPAGNSPLIQQSSATARRAQSSTRQTQADQAEFARGSLQSNRLTSRPGYATSVRVPSGALGASTAAERSAGVSRSNGSASPKSVQAEIAPEEFQERIDTTELELSVMVAEEPTVWQFDELAAEAQSLLNRSETALQRGRARILLGKIDRFASIKERHAAVNTLWTDTQNRNGQLADLRRQHKAQRPSGQGPADSQRFDGQGRLTRVVSPKRGAPRYALVDDAGDVQCYVTPAPGINLRHYEQRLIGINGSRGYVPEQRAHHIMAKRVNVLDAAPTKIR